MVSGYATPEPADERRHEPGSEALWSESWYFDFATADGDLGGYVRVGLYPNLDAAWYWAYVVRPGQPAVAVLDHHVPLPRAGLDLRTDGLWAAHECETPLEHWTLGLEAFGLALADPTDAYGEPRGEQVALGLDLEWETEGGAYSYPGVTRYEVPCRVHGELLIGDTRLEIDARGQRDHSWGVRDWWRFGWTWTSGWLDDGTAFHAFRPAVEGWNFEPGYVQPPGGPLTPIDGFSPRTETGPDGLPTGAGFGLDFLEGKWTQGDQNASKKTGSGLSLELDVEPLALAPVLLEGPDGQVSRFPRALCRYTAADGRTGHGWTEWNQPQ